MLRRAKAFAGTVAGELVRTRADVAAAALSYYFLLSLVALLVMLAALLGYLPISHPFHRILDMMGILVPAEEMAMMHSIAVGLSKPHRGGILSLGFLGYLWTASNGFSAAIEALDIAYDVKRGRSWWRERLQAMVLTGTTGIFILASLLAMMTGPRFGRFITQAFHLPHAFAIFWPTIRLSITFAAFVLAVETLYYLAPNCKQHFRSTFPGAVIAVAGWSLGSFCLNLYLSHFSDYSKTYGVLGSVMVIMLWFYIVSLAILTGAESNAELSRAMIQWREEDKGLLF
jgi:membrane protein